MEKAGLGLRVSTDNGVHLESENVILFPRFILVSSFLVVIRGPDSSVCLDIAGVLQTGPGESLDMRLALSDKVILGGTRVAMGA